MVVVAFFLITTNGEKDLQVELWFGAEVCVYIICPLLALTVFGTVNCCKVSLTSRLLPSYKIQAIKLNIGVTISTNVVISTTTKITDKRQHFARSALLGENGLFSQKYLKGG